MNFFDLLLLEQYNMLGFFFFFLWSDFLSSNTQNALFADAVKC